MSQSPKTKVFCVGFQKTGTSSMRDALASVGYKVADYYGTELSLEELRATYVELGLKMAAEHDAVQDMPWPLLYRELDEAFPGSKFILTLRDTDKWLSSMVKHFGDKPNARRQLTYGEGNGCPVGNEARYREVYEAHNSAVQSYFADRPDDFMVLDLAAGDGWDKLSAFLGLVDAPTGPFEHSNPAEMRSSASYKAMRAGKFVRNRVGKLIGLKPIT